MNYKIYQFSAKEWIVHILAYVIIDICISMLFYRSWAAVVIFLPGVVFYIKERKKQLIMKRKHHLTLEFLTGMQGVSAALSAGYSIENAVKEALKELQGIYKPDALMIKEFKNIVNLLEMNQNIEELLLDLGRRSEIEDICNFAEVFSVAKRSGGDIIAIIRHTLSAIRQKQEIIREINICIAGKRFEQKVMSFVPIFILVYVDLASPGFLDSMYHNIVGAAVMSMCLIVYLASWFLGRKIVNIEV